MYKLLEIISQVLYSLTGNYVVAMILFMVVLALIITGIDIKMTQNNNFGVLFKAKAEDIQRKYKTQEAVTEILLLQKKEGINNLLSAIFVLMQMYFLFGMINIVSTPLTSTCGFTHEDIVQYTLELKQVEGYAEVTEETSNVEIMILKELQEDEKIRNIDIELLRADIITNTNFNIVKIIAVVIMFVGRIINMVQQYIKTKKYQGRVNYIEMLLPIIITIFIGFSTRTLVGVYWAINTLIGLSVIRLYNKYLVGDVLYDLYLKNRNKHGCESFSFIDNKIQQLTDYVEECFKSTFGNEESTQEEQEETEQEKIQREIESLSTAEIIHIYERSRNI